MEKKWKCLATYLKNKKTKWRYARFKFASRNERKCPIQLFFKNYQKNARIVTTMLETNEKKLEKKKTTKNQLKRHVDISIMWHLKVNFR